MRLAAYDLHLSYNGREVLRGVDIEIAVPEVVAVVGPSGSGKTSLLSACGLLVKPETGTVSVDDVAVKRLSQLPPGSIAWVLQQSNAMPRRSLLDNVLLGPLAAGRSLTEARERAADAIAAVGLNGREQSAARELSGGELQRMCVARSIAGQPRLIFADEPTGGLDERNSEQVGELLRAATSRSIAVLIATHDLNLAKHCDRILEMRNGILSPLTPG